MEQYFIISYNHTLKIGAICIYHESEEISSWLTRISYRKKLKKPSEIQRRVQNFI